MLGPGSLTRLRDFALRSPRTDQYHVLKRPCSRYHSSLRSPTTSDAGSAAEDRPSLCLWTHHVALVKRGALSRLCRRPRLAVMVHTAVGRKFTAACCDGRKQHSRATRCHAERHLAEGASEAATRRAALATLAAIVPTIDLQAQALRPYAISLLMLLWNGPVAVRTTIVAVNHTVLQPVLRAWCYNNAALACVHVQCMPHI